MIRMIISIAWLLLTFSAQASELTESEAVTRALGHPVFQQAFSARQRQAEEESRSAGRWFNPEITYEREALDLPGGESRETTISLSQRFNLAGIKQLERAAARHNMEADSARNELLKRKRVTDTRMALYQTLMAEQQLSKLDALSADLNRLKAAIRARHEAGDASLYDAMRIDREAAIYGARRMELASYVKAEKERLEVLIGVNVTTIRGTLLPHIENLPSQEQGVRAHPLIAAYDAGARSASSRAKAADRKRWPDMTLSVGRRSVSEPGLETDGHIVALGMELPIGSNGKYEAAANRSHASLLEVERSMALRQLQAESTVAIERFQANKSAIEALTSHAEGSTMVSIAKASYNAGEISIMALLDAYSADYELNQRKLEHALAARLAYIHWQQLTGE